MLLKRDPTTFYAFEKEYTSKDINEIEINSDIYDDQKGISHVYGEYKEIDFIKDLLYKYVNEDESVMSIYYLTIKIFKI